MSKNRVKGSDTESKTYVGFNRVWSVLPHISIYQVVISAAAGYQAIIAGIMAMYPNFAQYKTPARCTSVFDTMGYNLT